MYNLFPVRRDQSYTRIGLETGVTIGGDATKSGKNTHLLVVMRMGLSQKIGLIELTNKTQFKKRKQL